MKFLFLSFALLAMNHLVGGERSLEDGEVYQPNIVVSCFESASPEGEGLLGFRVVSKNIIYSRSFNFVNLSFLSE